MPPPIALKSRMLAPGQCIMMNRIARLNIIPTRIPIAITNLSLTVFTSHDFRMNNNGKNNKLNETIPSVSNMLAPGQYMNLKNEPAINAVTELAPLTINAFFIA